MNAPAFCPSCGLSFARDEIIERDGFRLDPRGRVAFIGQDLALSRGEARLMHSVAASGDRTVRADTLGARISESSDPANVVAVLLCRIRKQLAAQDVPCPIVNRHGAGYRWECLA